MATDLQPPETQIPKSPQPQTSTQNPSPLLLDPLPNPPKRQRRPSVRLGEIGGDPPYEPSSRRPSTNKNSSTWRFHKDPSLASKSSKTRPLTNLVNGTNPTTTANPEDSLEISDNYNPKPKSKKPTKRARTNWSSKFDSGPAVNGLIEDENVEFRDFEGSESPVKEQEMDESPVNSDENMGLQFWDQHRRGNRGRVNSESGPYEVNSESGGVREWLVGLGLGKYAPVFEVHEVDDEVLPMLTLEDLKDMGISAVGSRRKMYASILKLQKGFS